MNSRRIIKSYDKGFDAYNYNNIGEMKQFLERQYPKTHTSITTSSELAYIYEKNSINYE